MNFKKCLPYIGSILFFMAVSYAYFLPDLAEGKVLFQHDTQQGVGVGQEVKKFREDTGEISRWTNSLFGGMPNYQISPSYGPSKVVSFLENCYRLWLPSPASLIFIMMVGFFILLVSLKMKWYLAVLGALAYAFSSYFFIIISAGHIWKFITLAYIPPTIAGVLLAYRGRYWTGGILTALFGTFQIASNHVQMTYYFLFVIVALVIGCLVDSIRNKTVPAFLKATAVLLFAGMLAIAVNLPNLYNTYEYSKQTIRGASELTIAPDGAPVPKTQSTKGGLDRDYIVHWSYGIGETWSLLIPDIKGGGSAPLGVHPEELDEVNPQYRQYLGQMMSRYWGDQPYTAGPVYVGAFVLTLFILGCFIVKGPMKWALLISTLLSIVLSWGRNFMPVTDFFIDYIPLYNKFRTVSSILVIAEFCIPLLAILALNEILKRPQVLSENRRGVLAGVGLTAGISLLFALFPSLFFSFMSDMEKSAYLPQAQGNSQIAELLASLESVRKGILTADAWRSFLIVAIGSAILFFFWKGKLGKYSCVALIGILILADVYSVDKRYLNSDHFVVQKRTADPFPMSAADKQILQDKDPNYRVLNLSVSTFDDATTSYYHKSVGGYHAAKLRRYQELIEHQLSKGNQGVIDMLNTKYIINRDAQGSPVAMRNPGAAGNAWFVSQVKWVGNADEEMAALSGFDPKVVAVIDSRFKKMLGNDVIQVPVSGDTIMLTSYKPNELTYKVHTENGGLAVFSEIYYPDGWQVTIDGKAAEEVRADYVLRALYLPKGTKEVVFRFDPKSVTITEDIAFVALGVLLLMSVGGLFFVFRKRKESVSKKNDKQIDC